MSAMSSCPDPSALERFALRTAGEAESSHIADHLVGCDRCSDTVGRLRAGNLEALLASSLVPPEPVDSPSREFTSPTNLLEISFLRPPEAPDEMGRLGAYRILKVLGHGGMGIVFHAEDPALGRPVALKVIRPEYAHKPSARQRFLREARACAVLKDDHVVRVYQVSEDHGIPFLAMEYLEGMPLDRWLANGFPLSLGQILHLARDVAVGLAAAHEAGLVHRDIKPSNVWLEGTLTAAPEWPRLTAGAGSLLPRAAFPTRCKILDFGLARPMEGTSDVTRSGVVLGTATYMAPEQARGEQLDGRCDLFSLGVLLYQLCTGRVPFKGPTTMAVLTAIASDTPVPVREVNPSIPPGLADLVAQLLEKDPANRPPSARAVLAALDAIEADAAERPATSDGQVAESREPSVEATLDRWPRHRMLTSRILRYLAIGVWLVALGLIALLVGRAPRPAESAADPPEQDPPPVVPEPDPVPAPAIAVVAAKAAAPAPVPVPVPVPLPVPVPESRLDGLRRERIVPAELAAAGSGDAEKAPKELVAILGSARLRPWGEVLSGAFHPNGEWFAAGTTDTVDLWHTTAERLLLTFRTPGRCVAFSPDGNRLIAGGDKGKADLWDPATGKHVAALVGHEGDVTAAVYSPDGALVATAGRDGKVRLWNAATGQAVRLLSGHRWEVECLAFSPDGLLLASGGGNGLPGKEGVGDTYVWDVASGAIRQNFAETDSVRGLAFLSRTRLASGYLLTPVVRIRDVAGGRDAGLVREAWAARGMTATPDGRRLVARRAGTGEAHCWDLGDLARPPVKLQAGRFSRLLGISRDGRRLACGHLGLEFLDLTPDGWTPRVAPPGAGVVALALPDDGRAVTTHADRRLRVWDVAAARELAERGRGGGADTFALATGGGRLAANFHDGGRERLEVWDATTGDEIGRFAVAKARVVALALRPDGSRLTALLDGVPGLRSWELPSWRELFTSQTYRGRLTCAAYAPDGIRLATGSLDGDVLLYNAATGEVDRRFAVGAPVVGLSFHPDGSRLAVLEANRLRVCSATDGATYFQEASRTLLSSAALSPDGRWLATASMGGEVVVREALSGRVSRRWELPGTVRRVVFAADSRHLLTGNDNGTVYVLRLTVRE